MRFLHLNRHLPTRTIILVPAAKRPLHPLPQPPPTVFLPNFSDVPPPERKSRYLFDSTRSFVLCSIALLQPPVLSFKVKYLVLS